MIRPRAALAVTAVLALGLLPSCTSKGSDRGAAALAPAGTSGAGASPAAAVVLPRVAVVGSYAGRIGAGAPITLAVTAGRIRGPVIIVPTLRGTTSKSGARWTSAETAPSTAYRVSLTVADSTGTPHRLTAAVRTTTTDTTLDARLTPGDGAVVGVGMPVSVSFDASVAKADRAAVERRLKVTTSHRLTGAWSWVSSTEAHFRPVRYWPAREPVRAAATLGGLYLPHSKVWGGARHTTAFRIGASHMSVADVAKHRLTVYSGGKKIHTFPASLGSTRWPSKGGVHIALEKSPSMTMDSATIGIPRDSPGGYYETVLWDVRISYGGAFVHSAPWSVSSQGIRNVSHGCVNLSPANARWFYGFAQRGDVVNVVHAVVGPDAGDPGTVDWNSSWTSWLQGSAIGAQHTTA